MSQQIKDCIASCKDVMQKLHQMSGQSEDKKLTSTINESIHHLEMCMYECEWALEQSP